LIPRFSQEFFEEKTRFGPKAKAGVIDSDRENPAFFSNWTAMDFSASFFFKKLVSAKCPRQGLAFDDVKICIFLSDP